MRSACLALLMLCSCRSEEAPAPVNDAGSDAAEDTGPTAAEIDTFNRLRIELEQKMQEKDVPGAALAVVLRGKLAFATGIGVKRAGTSDAVDEDSLFRVASMTKPIVAMGVMQQVEQGTIALDAPLKNYVPDFRRAAGYDPRKLLVKHLLSHSSGVPDEGPRRCSTDPAYLATWLASRATNPYWVPPGTLFNYSNPNFTLAAMALQQATGQTFEAYLHERVLQPAGMNTATFDPAAASADRTSGHVRTGVNKGKIMEFETVDCTVMRTFMGIVASAKDYAHFAEKLLARDPALVSEATYDDMFADHAATGLSTDHTAGYGFFNFAWRSRAVHSHDGRAEGWESFFAVVPSTDMAVVVLVNADGWGPASFGMHVIDAFNGEETYGQPDRSTPPSTWTQYAGTYNDALGDLGEMTVTVNMERMFMRFLVLSTTYEARQVSGDAFGFWVRDNPFTGTFFADKTGKYMYFASRDGVAIRTAAAPAAIGEPDTASAPSTPDLALAISHAHRALAPR